MKIRFTRPKLQELRNKYTNAIARGEDEFQFEGQTVLTSYAKYLIEYLDMQFQPTNNKAFDLTSE